jgi:hypothetical protein
MASKQRVARANNITTTWMANGTADATMRYATLRMHTRHLEIELGVLTQELDPM